LRMPGHHGTKTEIKERTSRNGPPFNTAFAELLADGDLIECEITKGNNRKYAAFKVRDDQQ
jgi:hypothetical protein